MSVITNKQDLNAINQDRTAITGIQKYWGKTKSLQIAGQAQTPAGMEGILQADIEATTAYAEAMEDVGQKRTARNAARAAAKQLLQDVKQYVVGVNGKGARTILQDLGFVIPQTPPARTTAEKSQSAEQAKATRKLRGTMGPKAKRAVKASPVDEAQVAPVATASASNGTPPASK
jgi:hypothetical protein